MFDSQLRVIDHQAVDIAEPGLPVEIITTDHHWQATWYAPTETPPGTPHGSAGVCLVDDQVVMVTEDGRRWQLPGGRPEPSEDWAATLRREVSEEACATVVGCRLLGFSRGVCLRGPEAGLVLVRALWLADVRLNPWMPEYEMVHRILVPVEQVWDTLFIPEGYEPIYRRIFAEAGRRDR